MPLVIENIESDIPAPEYAVRQLENILAKWLVRYLKSEGLLDINNSTSGKEYLFLGEELRKSVEG